MEIRIIIDDRIVNACAKLKALLSRRRLAAFVGIACLSSAAVVGAEALSDPIAFVPDTPIVAADVNQNFSGIYRALNEHVIRTNRTFKVAAASGCQGIRAAIDEVSEHHIHPQVSVTIELEAGIYDCGTSPLRLDNLYWPQVTLQGASSVADDTVIQMSGDTYGLTLARATLGMVRRLTIINQGPNSGAGIYATRNTDITIENVILDGFHDGLRLNTNSSALVRSTVARNNTRCGFRAYRASSIEIMDGSQALNNAYGGAAAVDLSTIIMFSGTRLEGGQYGAEARNGSYVVLSEATVVGQTVAAIYANRNGFLRLSAQTTLELGSGTTAFQAEVAGVIQVDSTVDLDQIAGTLSNIEANSLANDGSYVEIDS